MDQPPGPQCQSCGRPLARDEQGGGTEADGSKSTQYCSHCYQNGQFTLPDQSVTQMTERVQGMMRSRGVPEPQVLERTAGIPKLRRWQAAT